MKRLLLPLTVLALVALLHPSVPEAEACSCRGPRNVDEARQTLEEVDLAIEGAISAPHPDGVEIEIRAVYKGLLLSRIVLDQPADLVGKWSSNYQQRVDSTDPGCGYAVLGELGERYFLALTSSREKNGAYAASGCVSFAMRYVNQDTPVYNYYLQALPPGGGPPGGSTTFPDMPTAIATIGAAWFLGGAAFLWWRGRQRMGSG